MVYIICYDWPSTSGNHTGMRYLYEDMQRRNPAFFKLYIFNAKGHFSSKSKKKKKILVFLTALKLVLRYRHGDGFFLTEYLHQDSFQILFAKIIRYFYPKALVYGLVHLVPDELEKQYSVNKIRENSKYVTSLITLGSSLTSYLHNLGITNVYTSFHYVDNDYYKPWGSIREDEKVTAIVMGALARDFEQVAYIVSKLPEINFYVCKGREKIDYLFEGLENVTLVGYVAEDELKHYMNSADISLNVMKDTIGSNVICTSMAAGLAMVVSDVGSIRDYCDESNACFCSSPEDFIKSIKMLAEDRCLLDSFKQMSAKKAEKLSLDNYYSSLISFLK